VAVDASELARERIELSSAGPVIWGTLAESDTSVGVCTGRTAVELANDKIEEIAA